MTAPVRVLHVDDEASFGELVNDFLERQNERVDELASAVSHDLQRPLENLLSNATEHGSSEVMIQLGRTDDDFCIEDDGDGIPQSTARKCSLLASRPRAGAGST